MCVRHGLSDDVKCYTSLNHILKNGLNEIRKAEYAGAAGVLALLPTIGALLGAPTDEIWKLLNMVPIVGAMAMAMSFGASVLPINAKDYGSGFMRTKILREDPSEVENDAETSGATQPAVQTSTNESNIRASRLLHHVDKRLRAKQLFIAAIANNYIQLPFSKYWRLTMSDIPYNIRIEGGDDITTTPAEASCVTDVVGCNLKQLDTLTTGRIAMRGSGHYTKPRNKLVVMISVAERKPPIWKTYLWTFTTTLSIGVFITGTTMFASAQLLSISMAIFTLTTILADGVFSRTIAIWIVTKVEKADPLIHYIANSEREAHDVIAKLFTFELDGSSDPKDPLKIQRGVQIELKGHIFIDKRRVGKRSFVSRCSLWAFGIIRPAFDVAKDTPCEFRKDLEMEPLQSNMSGSDAGFVEAIHVVPKRPGVSPLVA
ncbi:hypothetical protein K402DRAFT_453379 [Aulographum hederae CBS 113979]|uniref:Uncharacterized protein n=1 Tax=Aulographum hederae CBS 113979 TaxID=1176131 RepID=A0A6G1H3A7_9PEZI|nr:hypothetical protein K402DRAFT_453379 [Aulographum hederae CBS 113979]